MYKKVTNNNKKDSRDVNIDVCRFIMSIFVVCDHTHPLSDVSDFLNTFVSYTLFMLAVPFFLMCSGYYFAKTINWKNNYVENYSDCRKYLFKQWIKLAKMYLLWSIFYNFIDICLDTKWFSQIDMISIMKKLETYLFSFVFNSSVYLFWFFSAMLFAYFYVIIFIRYLRKDFIIAYAVLLYFSGLLFHSYYYMIEGSILGKIMEKLKIIPAPVWALTRVLPFILVSIIYYEYEEEKTLHYYMKYFVLFYFLWSIEVLLNLKIGNNYAYYSIFTLPVAYYFFGIVKKMNIDKVRVSSTFLAKLSMFIYCFQYLLLHYIFPLDKYIMYGYFIRFICIISISILVGSIYVNFSDN